MSSTASAFVERLDEAGELGVVDVPHLVVGGERAVQYIGAEGAQRAHTLVGDLLLERGHVAVGASVTGTPGTLTADVGLEQEHDVGVAPRAERDSGHARSAA